MDITCDRADFLKFIRCSIICKLSVDNFSKFNEKKIKTQVWNIEIFSPQWSWGYPTERVQNSVLTLNLMFVSIYNNNMYVDLLELPFSASFVIVLTLFI